MNNNKTLYSRNAVLILIDSSFLGGPEKYILGYGKYLVKDICTIVATFSDSPCGNKFSSFAEKNGLVTKHIASSGSYDIRQIFNLIKLLRDNEVGVINCHGYRANIIGLICGWILNIPIISTFHGWTGCDLKVRLFEFIDKFINKKMDHLIAVSKKNKQRLINIGINPRTISTIPNAIDIDALQGTIEIHDPINIRRCLGIGRKSIVISSIGRLSPEKGQKILIIAFKDVLLHVPNSFLLLVGDGPDKSMLMDLACSLNIQKKVLFLGFREDIPLFLECSDIFVLPSLSEGLPTVVLEALAFSMPVVATAVGGTPEIIKNGETGLLVPPNRADLLAKGILACLNDPTQSKIMGSKGKKFIKENFTFQAHAGKIISLFKHFLKQ